MSVSHKKMDEKCIFLIIFVWQLAGFKQDEHSGVYTEGFLTFELRGTCQQRLKGTDKTAIPTGENGDMTQGCSAALSELNCLLVH